MSVTMLSIWDIRFILLIDCSDRICWLQVVLCKSSINKKQNVIFRKCRIISYILNRKIMITIVISSFFWTLRIADLIFPSESRVARDVMHQDGYRCHIRNDCQSSSEILSKVLPDFYKKRCQMHLVIIFAWFRLYDWSKWIYNSWNLNPFPQTLFNNIQKLIFLKITWTGKKNNKYYEWT